MAVLSVDTFAATNPALCCLILRAFIEGYTEGDPEGVPFPLILLPLPLVLVEEIAVAFVPTNATTGLLPWLGRFPEVTIGLGDRIMRTAEFSRAALLFGLRQRVLVVTPAGRVNLEAAGLRRKPNFPSVTEAGRATSYAKRLGSWCGQVRSTETVYLSLGVHR